MRDSYKKKLFRNGKESQENDDDNRYKNIWMRIEWESNILPYVEF